MAVEVELKLSVDPEALAALRRHPAIARWARGPWRTTRIASTYFDTPAGELRSAGVALRVRRIGRRWLQTVKNEGSQLAGLSTRSEFEWPLNSPRIDAAKLSETPWRDLFDATAGRVKARFVTDIVRRSRPLTSAQGTKTVIALDRGQIRAGRKRAPIAEIEIEVVEGTPAFAYELARDLVADFPVAIEHRSKAERGYALLQRGPPEPVRARTVDLAHDISAPAAIAAVGADCLLQIGANARYVALGIDSEFLHQLRVGVRRLRSLLKLAEPLTPQDAFASFDDEMTWLTNTLGPARDWDVFTTETLPAVSSTLHLPPLRRDMGQLKGRATRMRGVRCAAAKQTADSPRLTLLLLALGARFAALTVGEPGAAAASSARSFAQGVLDQCARRLKKRAKRLLHASPVERHRARIAAKKLRYAAEFFTPLYSGGRSKAYLAKLAKLQTALGNLNDMATAQKLAEELAQRGKVSFAVARASGVVIGWAAGSEARQVAAAAKAWRKCAKVKPFWNA
ncbi:MAG: CHAD domain-containing protein [Betaproteobacteria bacterium]|nr:MAG: CHAD domain-containing protein [Betaproteobacteria bacterium]